MGKGASPIEVEKLLTECATPTNRKITQPQKRGASQVEVYGFVAWVTSGVLYFLYLLWAFLPNAWLEAVGITYYPDKYWALAVPTWASMVLAYLLIGYECLAKMKSKPPTSRSTLEDSTPQWTEQELDEMKGSTRLFPLKDIPPILATKMLFKDNTTTPKNIKSSN